jgi:hypothetical protein
LGLSFGRVQLKCFEFLLQVDTKIVQHRVCQGSEGYAKGCIPLCLGFALGIRLGGHFFQTVEYLRGQKVDGFKYSSIILSILASSIP